MTRKSKVCFRRKFVGGTAEAANVAPVRLAMIGDSLSTCFQVCSPLAMLLRARLSLGNWVVDDSGEIDSVFERLSRAMPVVLHHFACVSAHVMFNKRSIADRVAEIFHYCHQVDRVLELKPFPEFVLLWIGHNDLDWVERRPGRDLARVNLDELAEDTVVAYAAQFDRLLERASRQSHPVTFVVFALVSFEQFFEARAETEAIKAKNPARYPYLEADYRYFESMRPGRREGMITLANAVGAWDNAKKIVEVELRQKGTDLHAATVVGDTVGDPFKDTSSVAMNPVIKFTTLFGLLAVEIAVTMTNQNLKTGIGVFFFLVALFFVYRSFYGMRIPEDKQAGTADPGPSKASQRWRAFSVGVLATRMHLETTMRVNQMAKRLARTR